MNYWINTIALFKNDIEKDTEGKFAFDLREIEAYNLATDNHNITIWLKSGNTITINMTMMEFENKLIELDNKA